MTTAIDLFAGMGGFTAGAEAANVQVLWAANHWQAAVDTHARNHPHTAHICQDLHQANWSQVPAHNITCASPACQGHALARGEERPHHDACRSTAWAVVSCAEFHTPDALVVENVPEFLNWTLYPAWKLALESLGYSLAPHHINAADHGVPQHRHRVFIICTRSRHPIDLRASLPRRPHVSFASVMDTDDDPRTWTPTSRLCAATRSRIARGRRTYPTGRFLVRYNGSAVGGLPINEPIGALTTRDRFSIVDADHDTARILSVPEYRRAMGFPASYELPTNKKLAKFMLGNAVCPPVVTDILNALRSHI